MTDIPTGFWRNAVGDLVAETNVKPEHKLEDELVKKLATRAEALSGAIAAFRTEALSEIDAYRDLIRQKYGAKRGGAAGNVTLSAFDGSLQIHVQVAKHLSFGPELQAAKDLIDACVTRWSEGANDNLRTLIFDAFKTDRQGKISTDRVLGLRQLDIHDEDWSRAMEAISDAVRVTGSKTYLRLYKKPDPDSPLRPIALDMAAV